MKLFLVAAVILGSLCRAQNSSSGFLPPSKGIVLDDEKDPLNFTLRLDDPILARSCILAALNNTACTSLSTEATPWAYTSTYHITDASELCERVLTLCPILLRPTDAGVVPGWPPALLSLVVEIWTILEVDKPMDSFSTTVFTLFLSSATTIWWWIAFGLWRSGGPKSGTVLNTSGWIIPLINAVRTFLEPGALRIRGARVDEYGRKSLLYATGPWFGIAILLFIAALAQGITSFALAWVQVADVVGTHGFVPAPGMLGDGMVYLRNPRFKKVAAIRAMEVSALIPAALLTGARTVLEKLEQGQAELQPIPPVREKSYKEIERERAAVTKPMVVAAVVLAIIARVAEAAVGLLKESREGHWVGEGQSWMVIATSDRFNGFDSLRNRAWVIVRSAFNAG